LNGTFLFGFRLKTYKSSKVDQTFIEHKTRRDQQKEPEHKQEHARFQSVLDLSEKEEYDNQLEMQTWGNYCKKVL
jgi:coproporphyrinogen III oxidase-like Fe-S oxidoreductase